MIVASILHGAYGDYYEQALCLKHYQQSNPGVRLRLYAESQSRLRELSVLDFSFAECFEHWPKLQEEKEQPDRFFQFHAQDAEFQESVIQHLDPALRAKIDTNQHLLPWRYLRGILPRSENGQLTISAHGHDRLPEVLSGNGINASDLSSLSISFLWRQRKTSSAIKPYFQQSPEALVEKYSRVFNRLIKDFGCKVFICGMNVVTDDSNRHRVDAKFASFGLDLPANSSVHLKGLSWALELELMLRTTISCGHPSGFTEALDIRRPGFVTLVDPQPHYVLKMMKHRMPFFGNGTIPGTIHNLRFQQSEQYIYNTLSQRLRTALQKSGQ